MRDGLDHTRDKRAIVAPRSKLQDRDLARERVRVKFRKEIIAVIKRALPPPYYWRAVWGPFSRGGFHYKTY